MTWPRLLAIILLVPLLPGALRSRSLFHYRVDKYVLTFVLLNAALAFRDVSITAGLRQAIYLSLDIVAPYFVLSRYLTSVTDVRDSLKAFLTALVIVGLINIYESVFSWNIFIDFERSVTDARASIPTVRAGLLRAFGPIDRPSQSGFALAAGLGVAWTLLPYFRRRGALLLVSVLGLGLLLTFSRGSWVAAGLIALGYAATTNVTQLLRVFLISLFVVFVFSLTQLGNDILTVLPFVGDEGTEASRTVEYRETLFDASILVAHENPLFGSTTYSEHPAMEAIRQGSGILDIVNHYLYLLLRSGYAGLLSFASVFACAITLLVRTLQKSTERTEDWRQTSKALLFTFAGLLVAIAATSALARTGVILWCLVAISACVTGAFKSSRVVTPNRNRFDSMS